MKQIIDEAPGIIGTIDRLREYSPYREVHVTLECGYNERFWNDKYTDEEYLKRTIHLKSISNKVFNH